MVAGDLRTSGRVRLLRPDKGRSIIPSLFPKIRLVNARLPIRNLSLHAESWPLLNLTVNPLPFVVYQHLCLGVVRPQAKSGDKAIYPCLVYCYSGLIPLRFLTVGVFDGGDTAGLAVGEDKEEKD